MDQIFQIFNELSADGSYSSRAEAGKAIVQLARLTGKMCSIGFSPFLMTTENVALLQMCEGYTILNCLYDNFHAQEPEMKLLMISATKAPHIEGLLNDEQGNTMLEFRYRQVQALGLGLGSIRNIPVLSLNCFSEEGEIELERTSIIDDGSLQTSTVHAETISSCERFTKRRAYLHTVAQSNIKNGKDLCSNFEKLFPNLKLSDRARKDICSLNGNEEFFREFMRHFSVLSDEAKDWNGGCDFMPKGIDCSPESTETLKRYEMEHTFICCDGTARLFSLHSKIFSANKRIYFSHDKENSIVHIGHAGDHLPTVDYH